MPVSAATAKRRAKQRERLAGIGIDLHERVTTGRNKFHAVSATYRGERYDSAGEAEYAQGLDLKMMKGEITDWERPKPVAVAACGKCLALAGEACIDAKGRHLETFHKERITYKPDFFIVGTKPTEMLTLRAMPTGYYVDYKGSRITETAAWRIKVRLWKLYVPHELRVAYGDGTEKVVCTGADAIQERIRGKS